MPFKKNYRKSSYSKKARTYRPSRLKTVKKMTGGTPETTVEKIARYGGAIGKVAGTVARIMTFINVETKYYEPSVSGAVPNTGGYTLCLNDIAGGTAENQRIGEKVVNKDLIINWLAKVNASATNTVIKVIVIMDKKPEVSQPPTYTQIMNSTSVISQSNKDNSDRFIFLKTIMLQLSPNSNPSLSGKMYLPLSKIHTSWNSSTGTDFEQNAIYLLAVSDEATNTPNLAIISRINYYDN